MSATERFRAWHIPQIPGRPFVVETDTLAAAALIYVALGEYDEFQLSELIKPDYASTGGIDFLDTDGEWEPVDEDEIAAAVASSSFLFPKEVAS